MPICLDVTLTTDPRTSVATEDSRLYSLPLMPYKDVAPPAGEKITRTDKLNVPDQPVIPFIRGDGTGPDIWAASVRVFDAAVEKAYGGKKKNRVVRGVRRPVGKGQIR